LLMFAARGPAPWMRGFEPVSRGDKVIVCSAGKFGERWAEMPRPMAWTLQCSRRLMEKPWPLSVEAALAAEPATKAVFAQASETSTARFTTFAPCARGGQNGRHFVLDAITGLGTMPLDIDGWGWM